MKPERARKIAAINGFLGVALGAFGAHGLQGRLETLGTISTYDTAVLYHLVHAGMLYLVSRDPDWRPRAWWAFALGMLLFSGSLYVLALTGIKALGMITPLGGVGLLAGWLLLLGGGQAESR